MAEPKWMEHVRWPACDDCKATGVRVDPRTQWPEECLRCKAGREAAVKSAQSYRRRELRRERSGVASPPIGTDPESK